MHIGFVTPESPYGSAGGGGIAAYLRAILPALAERGHQVTVFARSDAAREFWTEQDRVRVLHFRLPSLHWYLRRVPLARRTFVLPLRQLEWSWAFARNVRAAARRDAFDVLEATETGGLFLSAIAPTVIRLHGSEWIFRTYTGQPIDWNVQLGDWLEKRACEKASVITTPSHFQAREIAAHRGWNVERIRVIPNPIAREMLEAGLATPPRTPTDAPNILYTGRLAPVKGIEILLQAARLALPQMPTATFVLAGAWQMPQPPQRYGLELDARSPDGVLWVGPKTRDELIRLYRQATCFVMPSLYETFGISVLEAMAFGLPVVATRAGGLPEVLSGTNRTRLVPSGDVQALAQAIVDALYNPSLEREQISVSADFSAERVADKTLELYRKLTG